MRWASWWTPKARGGRSYSLRHLLVGDGGKVACGKTARPGYGVTFGGPDDAPRTCWNCFVAAGGTAPAAGRGGDAKGGGA